MITERMIYITGFARGGTSWLRDCVGSHPDIEKLPKERVVFKDYDQPEKIRAHFAAAVEEHGLSNAKWIVNKAPANAPYFGKAARALPEAKFIFIIRDPRDVFVSHKRGNQAWMGGVNSTVRGCMRKTAKYFEGWLESEGLPNVHLVRYEDLHQNFYYTMASIFSFIGVETTANDLTKCCKENDFRTRTARKNKEDRSSARRKGAIGDWAIHLKPKERDWFAKSELWQDFMRRYNYQWSEMTYPAIIGAMSEGGCHFIDEDELLAQTVHMDRVNVTIFHDIDDLRSESSFESIRRTALAESEVGAASIYNFLPLDDVRYAWTNPRRIVRIMNEIKELNPKASIGLHFNACEKFFPAAAPDLVNETPDLSEAMKYLHEQVDAYQALGVNFRTATAHGYGRGQKRPNNLHTREFADVLLERGISLYDTKIRPTIRKKATYDCSVTDVGGVIKASRMRDDTSIISPKCYREMPDGSLVRFLTHPGNYEADKPAVLSMRDLLLT